MKKSLISGLVNEIDAIYITLELLSESLIIHLPNCQTALLVNKRNAPAIYQNICP